MKVLVIGGTPQALDRLRALAAPLSSGIDVFDERGPTVPDWVLTATGAQRATAIDTYKLPPYRVLEMDVLLSEPALSQAEDRVRAALTSMVGIGAVRPQIPSIGVPIARLVVRALRTGGDDGSLPGAADPQSVGGTDTPLWPPGAIAWTSGREAQLERYVAPPDVVGPALDVKLQDLMRKRVRRFARQRLHWKRRRDGGSQ